MSNAYEFTEKMTAEYEEMKKKYRSMISDAMKQDFKTFLSNHPGLMISWTQYTPHFNDGEPCEFTVHEFSFNDVTALHNNDDRFYDGIYGFWWSGKPYEKPENSKLSDQEFEFISKDCNEFKKVLESIEDGIFLAAFGDGVSVDVYLDDKGEVTYNIEEYEHD
jgi:hypothetical protein